MSKYRKKTPALMVEAFQMTKERRLDKSEWPDWLHEAWLRRVTSIDSMFCSNGECLENDEYMPLFINTIKGLRKVDWGDWIIKGVGDHIYPHSWCHFRADYEEVKVTACCGRVIEREADDAS